MMLLRFVFVMLALLLPGVNMARARVGETLDQCKARYGKAIPVATPYVFGPEAKELVYFQFHRNGIQVLIGFLNGTASDLTFQHMTPRPTPDAPSPAPAEWLQVEIDTLLAANANGLQWKTVPDGKLTFFPDSLSPNSRYGVYEQRDDGVVETVDGPALHIFTPDWLTYINTKMLAHQDAEIAKQKKNLDGF